MKHSMKKLLSLLAVMMVLFGTLAVTASAESGFFTSYTNYEYNYYNESVSAPVSYVFDGVFTAEDMKVDGELVDCSDMAFCGDSLYILDAGNDRILELDTNLKHKKTHSGFVMDGEYGEESVSIMGAAGFYVYENGDFLIADHSNMRILRISNGRVTQVIEKPDSPSIDEDVPFYVRKVTVGSQGRIYALVETLNQGALVFSDEGEFLTFFGSNKVKQTAEVISKFLWRKFMSEEQLKAMDTFTPVNMTNFDIDPRGFMISVTKDAASNSVEGTVRRINYKNSDVLNSPDMHTFGDLEWNRDKKVRTGTSFCDVDVDYEGFYALLDDSRGRVFVYSNSGDFVSVFALKGNQAGATGTPVAIETIGEKVYILDAAKRAVLVYSPTEYAKKYRSAILSLENGDQEQSLAIWQELLNENTNNELVYHGMGRVYDEQKDYAKAMEYFKLAKDQESYSYAFKEYRKDMIQDNFLPIAAVAVVLVVVLVIAVRLAKKKLLGAGDSAYGVMESKWLFPIYTLTHPADGFIQFKTRKHIRSWEMTFGFVISWFLLEVLKFFATGFIFNSKRISDFNLFITAAATFGLYLLFIIGNWAVCTLIEGKGTLPEIMTTTSYALLPYLVTILINTILSNFFALDEGSFITIISYIGLVWTALVLFVGLSAIHEYSVAKTVLSVILTIIAMAIMLFLIILFYTLVTQTISFVMSIIQEVSLRM